MRFTAGPRGLLTGNGRMARSCGHIDHHERPLCTGKIDEPGKRPIEGRRHYYTGPPVVLLVEVVDVEVLVLVVAVVPVVTVVPVVKVVPVVRVVPVVPVVLVVVTV